MLQVSNPSAVTLRRSQARIRQSLPVSTLLALNHKSTCEVVYGAISDGRYVSAPVTARSD